MLEVDGRPQAYAIYRLNAAFGSLGPETTIVTLEVVGATPAATASIWRYLLDIDWTQTVSARLQPVDSPLFLLLARPNFSRPVISDGLWIRLVDVGTALEQRAYTGDGALVLDLRDEFCPWNEGCWRVGPGESARTTYGADLALEVSDLAGPYLGGFTFRELQRAGRVVELRDGAVARADKLFRSDVAPWCPEIF